MLIPLDRLRSLYDQIIRNALDCEGQGTTIYIFTSNDTDSLCSMKMFTILLKADEMQYNCIPVFSNSHLVEELRKLDGKSHVRSLIFINCGGLLDHTQLWYYKADLKVQAFIMDHHRPFNHNNIIDPYRKVFIVHDGCSSFDKYPTAEDAQLYAELAQDEDDDDDDGYDYDSEDDEVKDEIDDLRDDEKSEQREQKEDEDLDEDVYGDRVDKEAENDEEVDIVGADDDGEEAKVGSKRQRPKDALVLDRRQLKRQKRALFKRYYSGTFYWKCSSWVMYQLATALSRDSNDMLWMWILGMTDLIVHARSGSYSFDSDLFEASNEVQRLNPNIYNKDKDEEQPLQEEQEDEDTLQQQQQQSKEKDLYKDIKIKSRNKEIGAIILDQDLKLMLLRHWTLYDSLCNSNYMVSKLDLTKEPGQKQLKRLLAILGISLDQAKQKFNFMEPSIRNTFKQNFIEKAPYFQLDNIAINTFVRQIDQKTQISAIDMVYALSSIIECPRRLAKNSYQLVGTLEESKRPSDMGGQNMLSNRITSLQLNQTNLTEQMQIEQNLIDLQDVKYQNYWVAYDALEQVNKSAIDMGIELAKDMQQAIVRIGTAIIEKKEVKLQNDFRYVYMDNDSLKDISLFQYPLALQKLALFIMDTYKIKRAKAKERPLVMAVKNSKKGQTLIIAVLGSSRESGYSRNNFGTRFRQAAEEKGIKAKFEGFDSAIIEIKSSEFRPFMEELAHQTE